MADKKALRHTLDLARKCVLSGEPHRAIGLLSSIQAEIDDLTGESLWAEHQSTYAVALAAMNDPGAEAAFVETLKQITILSEPDLPLEMRTRADFAKFLAGMRACKRAREQYQLAEKLGDRLEGAEDVAHFQLCVIRIDLELDGSPHLAAFRNMRGAARAGYTSVEQRDAWMHYTE